MAMVTPLPGMNPSQQESSYHSQENDSVASTMNYESDSIASSEKDRERLNSNVDCTSEVIERWKGLVDMKDTILRQKNLQIERLSKGNAMH